MKSIKLVLLSIALMANTAHPMAKVATCLKKYMPHIVATTGVTIANLPWQISLVNAKIGETRDKESTRCLNNISEDQPLIKDLLNTYADGKNVKIHFRTSYLLDYTNPIDAYVHHLSIYNKIVVLKCANDAIKNFDHPLHHTMRGILGHELGHVKNGNFFHTINFSSLIGTTICLSAFLSSKSFQRKHWLLKPFILTSTICLKIIADYGFLLVSGKWNEYSADQNVIQHAKDPRDLRGVASNMRQHGNEPGYTYSFFDTHQHPITRAKKFEKAADKLEKRLAQQKSL